MNHDTGTIQNEIYASDKNKHGVKENVFDIDEKYYTISKIYRKRNGTTLYVVRKKYFVDKKTFVSHCRSASKYGRGYFSNNKIERGFVFDSLSDAKNFAEEVINNPDIKNMGIENAEYACEMCGTIFRSPQKNSAKDNFIMRWSCPICNANNEYLIRIKAQTGASLNKDIQHVSDSVNKRHTLHYAIREIVSHEGTDVIKEMRFLNILDDYKAFILKPSLRFVLSSIVAKGYAEKILNMGEPSIEINSIVHQFLQRTGFQLSLINTVFQNLLWGLNYINSIESKDVIEIQSVMKDDREKVSSKLTLGYEEINSKGQLFEKQYTKECENYIDSLVVMKGDWDKLGAFFKLSSKYLVYGNCARLAFNLEICGKIKNILKNCEIGGIDINIILFNMYNRLIGKLCSRIYKDTFKNEYRNLCIGAIDESDFKYIGNISRVVMYWDY